MHFKHSTFLFFSLFRLKCIRFQMFYFIKSNKFFSKSSLNIFSRVFENLITPTLLPLQMQCQARSMIGSELYLHCTSVFLSDGYKAFCEICEGIFSIFVCLYKSSVKRWLADFYRILPFKGFIRM